MEQVTNTRNAILEHVAEKSGVTFGSLEELADAYVRVRASHVELHVQQMQAYSKSNSEGYARGLEEAKNDIKEGTISAHQLAEMTGAQIAAFIAKHVYVD